ncbi:MAG: hypothetical protein KZQ97_22115, partial [Candidatus Thiodiazotropha sp. (ex Dulcina madagascariensis)]|nr:hypothetical protein [Candidatus Thiodiazotropha sp. (ex Dulcina madagascariensis)]
MGRPRQSGDVGGRIYAYDRHGNRSTQTNERGHLERFHYDAHNRLAGQWNMAQLDAAGEIIVTGD